MFGFGKPKCAQCGMEFKPETEVYEWQEKKFCCQDCKTNFRHKKVKGGSCCY